MARPNHGGIARAQPGRLLSDCSNVVVDDVAEHAANQHDARRPAPAHMLTRRIGPGWSLVERLTDAALRGHDPSAQRRPRIPVLRVPLDPVP